MKPAAQINRRSFLAGLAAYVPELRPLLAEEELPPVRAITRGPKFHWFGYYDKLQFDPAGRHVLANQVDFEHRSPRAEDVINPSGPASDHHLGKRLVPERTEALLPCRDAERAGSITVDHAKLLRV